MPQIEPISRPISRETVFLFFFKIISVTKLSTTFTLRSPTIIKLICIRCGTSVSFCITSSRFFFCSLAYNGTPPGSTDILTNFISFTRLHLPNPGYIYILHSICPDREYQNRCKPQTFNSQPKTSSRNRVNTQAR